MANTYKDIVITPNKSSSTDDPKIVFSGANASVNTDITLRVYPESNGTLSFEGSAGQLFSITNDLSGSIFSVNDISGIPSIDVQANGAISLAPYGGNVSIEGSLLFADTVGNKVGIGRTDPGYTFDVVGTVNASSLLINGVTALIPSNVHYIGTTSIALNRTSASQSLTGVSIDGSAGSATTSTTQALTDNSTNIATTAWYNKAIYSTRGGLNLSGGGTVSYSGGYVKWTSRFIIISDSKGTSTPGGADYYDINCPSTGSIDVVGTTAVTATASGIPLGAWQALYYDLGDGSGGTASSFHIVSYSASTANYMIPADWVLIAAQNQDNNYVKFTNGIQLQSGNSYDTNTYDTYSTPYSATSGSAGTLTTARTLTLGSTGKTFNGSADVSWTLSEMGALPTAGGTLTGRVVQSDFGFVSGTKDDITLRCNSGFWQTSSATTAEGWPENSSTWAHLISSTHTNDANYYAMQFAGSFYDSNSLYYRATNGSGTTAWNKIWHAGNDGTGSGLDADTLDGQHASSFVTSGGALGTPSSGTLTNCTGLPVGGISATGSASATTYLRGDGSWQTISAGGLTVNVESSSANTYYPLFTSNTTGSVAFANVDSGDLYYVPVTGTLSAKIFNSLSDITLKTDIEGFDGIALLDQINPVSFKWASNNVKSYGVIAQELEKTLPELVDTNDKGIKSVSYIPMIAMLIDTVKKQEERITKLEQLLNAK